mgnify:CR=1 FL=1
MSTKPDVRKDYIISKEQFLPYCKLEWIKIYMLIKVACKQSGPMCTRQGLCPFYNVMVQRLLFYHSRTKL